MKTFKQFTEEAMTAGDAGIPQDTKNMGRKKRRPSILTRHYIEVNGKIKKRAKMPTY